MFRSDPGRSHTRPCGSPDSGAHRGTSPLAWLPALVLPVIVALAAAPGCLRAQPYAEEDRDWGVAATSTLRRPPYTAPTPTRIPGGNVLTTMALNQMLKSEARLWLIDVASGDGHQSVAGAHWIPGAGHGTNFLDPLQSLMKERLARLSGGDLSSPLVFFCVNAQCWLSYNAALRAIALGYSRVFWYRGGIEAWRRAGLPLVRVAHERSLDAPMPESRN